MERGGPGWWLRWRGVAPDAHTPTPTNYHCVTGNKEEVKTGTAPAQMSRFVRFTPESVQTKRTTVQVTSNAPPHPHPPTLSQQTLSLAPQQAPFGARMGPIIQGKVIHGRTLRCSPSSGWISVPRPRVPFVSVEVHTSLLSDPAQATVGGRVDQSQHRTSAAARARSPLCVQASELSGQ